MGGEKRQGLEGVVASRSSDTRPSCDVPYCSSVSVFKLTMTDSEGRTMAKMLSNENSNPALHILTYSIHVSSLPEWG